jgi:2-oxoglutarate ferredoxin oxidoreductase subunit alpha
VRAFLESIAPLFSSKYRVNRGKLVSKQKNYQRYALAEDGISPRSVPGVGNHVVANSDEHDTRSYTNEEITVRNAQMQKRMQKLITCTTQSLPAPKLYGPNNAKLTIVSSRHERRYLRGAPRRMDVNFLPYLRG